MPVNWQDKATQDRLLTAVIASVQNKINVAEIARLYAQEEMTYHAVENYLRKFRKEAKNMMAGQPSGGDASPAVTPAKASSARKRKAESPAKNAVKTGRVTKARKTPAMKLMKTEMSDEESYFGNVSGYGSLEAEMDEDEDEEMLV